jgi:hypothetical protein
MCVAGAVFGAVFGGSWACGAAAAHNHNTAMAILDVRFIIFTAEYTAGKIVAPSLFAPRPGDDSRC